jgi:maltooligosyltrehalose trehalohydrolase
VVSRSGWKLPYGAELKKESGVWGTHFRVAAPGKNRVELALAKSNDYRFIQLKPEGDGNFSIFLPGIGEGARYKFRLDDDLVVPDPYSRFQPDDVHGNSAVIDPEAFEWQDDGWRGRRISEMIIYELHVGTFTQKGTFEAIIDHLDYLLDLGINTIELMPIVEFPGTRNWGYDGVQYFAPDSSYGDPKGLKRLIDACHQREIAVLIDLVYNHFGPDGNYLWSYSRDYFTPRHKTPWGDAPNYDGVRAELMRTYVLQNTLFWINEYHVDGLRLDATFAIIDESRDHILKEIARELHSEKSQVIPRTIIAEDHRNLPSLHWPQPEGYGLDGQWIDDFHHVVHCYFTGEKEGYYENYKGNLEELVKTINEGFLYQGQNYVSWKRPRGKIPEGLRGDEMIICIQNHDQVGNRAFGERLHHIIDRESYHVAVGLLFLSPYTPLLFMGQEYAARQPFQFFTDHHEELGRAVTSGRQDEFKEFSIFTDPGQIGKLPDPQAETTFSNSKLDLSEHSREPYVWTYRLHRQLIGLTKSEPALKLRNYSKAQTSIIGQDAIMLLRKSDSSKSDLLVIANLGRNEVKIDLTRMESYLERDRWPLWHSPYLSTLSEEFGGSGNLPKVVRDKQNLLLPAQGLFLYKLEK